jgi:hypothetical protein
MSRGRKVAVQRIDSIAATPHFTAYQLNVSHAALAAICRAVSAGAVHRKTKNSIGIGLLPAASGW